MASDGIEPPFGGRLYAYPTTLPAASTPVATPLVYPTGRYWFRSTTLFAVPCHTSAWRTEPGMPRGPTQPSPTCLVGVRALTFVSLKPNGGCRSTKLAAVPLQRAARWDPATASYTH